MGQDLVHRRRVAHQLVHLLELHVHQHLREEHGGEKAGRVDLRLLVAHHPADRIDESLGEALTQETLHVARINGTRLDSGRCLDSHNARRKRRRLLRERREGHGGRQALARAPLRPGETQAPALVEGGAEQAHHSGLGAPIRGALLKQLQRRAVLARVHEPAAGSCLVHAVRCPLARLGAVELRLLQLAHVVPEAVPHGIGARDLKGASGLGHFWLRSFGGGTLVWGRLAFQFLAKRSLALWALGPFGRQALWVLWTQKKGFVFFIFCALVFLSFFYITSISPVSSFSVPIRGPIWPT